MRMHRFVVAVAVLLTLGVATPAHAQFGAIKKGFDKLKGIRITTKDSTDNKDVEPESKPKKLKDGETAVIHVGLSTDAVTTKVKAYFNNKDVDYTFNPDTGRIITDWFGERRCGPGFYRCANRATIRVVAEEGNTTIRVQVVERKREGGINEKPWKDGTTSKGKETAQLAVELEAFLAGNTVAIR